MPGMLNELNLKTSYRGDECDIVTSFYEPCLAHAQLYRRAVGYFTSHSLACVARGMGELVRNGGVMRLIASPCLSAEDIEAIEKGYLAKSTVLERAAGRTFADVEDSLERDRLNALAWLIAVGVLDVRLAVRVDGDGRPRRGIYHEKIGVFSERGCPLDASTPHM